MEAATNDAPPSNPIPIDGAVNLSDLLPSAFVPTLWLACSTGELPAVEWLVDKQGLSGLEIATDDHRAFRLACQDDHIDLANWLTTMFGVENDASRAIDCQAFRHACCRGSMQVVELVGCRLEPDDIRARGFEVLAEAAAGGHLPVLEWLSAEIVITEADVHANNHAALRRATEAGHDHVAWWLAEKFYSEGQDPAPECMAALGIH